MDAIVVLCRTMWLKNDQLFPEVFPLQPRRDLPCILLPAVSRAEQCRDGLGTVILPPAFRPNVHTRAASFSLSSPMDAGGVRWLRLESVRTSLRRPPKALWRSQGAGVAWQNSLGLVAETAAAILRGTTLHGLRPRIRGSRYHAAIRPQLGSRHL